MFNNICSIENADLSKYSTIKIGGKARWLVFPKDEKELVDVFEISNKNGYEPLAFGNGSNILFDVDFFDGVVVCTKHLNKIQKLGECRVEVGAGVNLFFLNCKLKEFGLGGMEWSYGIPGSLGGLVFMNGGAFGSEIKDVLEIVTVFDGNEVKTLNIKDLHFSYRASNLNGLTILKATLSLYTKNRDEIEKEMQDYLERRKKTQPYEPSLGSVYKRVIGKQILYPAKMIDSLGLKGAKIGGVEVSEKHAGFIVNCGNGTASDFLKLMKLIEKKVYQNFEIKLEKEIILMSEKEKK